MKHIHKCEHDFYFSPINNDYEFICHKCGYTELYRGEELIRSIENGNCVFDLYIGNCNRIEVGTHPEIDI